VLLIAEFGLTILFTRKENISNDPVKHSQDFSFSNQVGGAVNLQNSGLKEARKRNKITIDITLYATAIAIVLILVEAYRFFHLRYLLLCEIHFKKLAVGDKQVK
jgi:hypothetical protein